MKIESNTHSKSIINWASRHPEALVLSADLGSSCEIKEFGNTFPDRYFSLGIAEQNMVSWAAGLAREGYRPFLHTFGVFLYRRVLDQLEMSVTYPNLPVTFVAFLPGIMTPGGVSHQAINDIASLRAIPNLTIFDMGDATEIESVLKLANDVNGPVFIRMLRKDVPRLFPADKPMEFNTARILSEGSDILILSSSICTEEAIRGVEVLKARGVSIQHLHISTIKPFTDPLVIESLNNAKQGIVTFENHLTIGGLGSAVAELMVEHRISKKFKKVGINDTYTHGASKMYLMKKYNLDARAMIDAVEDIMEKKYNIADNDLEKIRFVDFTAV